MGGMSSGRSPLTSIGGMAVVDKMCIRDRPSGEVIKMPRTPVYFREAGAPDPVVAPTVGADTEVVLKECGYTDEEIKKMAEEKVVGLGDTWDRSMYVIKF